MDFATPYLFDWSSGLLALWFCIWPSGSLAVALHMALWVLAMWFYALHNTFLLQTHHLLQNVGLYCGTNDSRIGTIYKGISCPSTEEIPKTTIFPVHKHIRIYTGKHWKYENLDFKYYEITFITYRVCTLITSQNCNRNVSTIVYVVVITDRWSPIHHNYKSLCPRFRYPMKAFLKWNI